MWSRVSGGHVFSGHVFSGHVTSCARGALLDLVLLQVAILPQPSPTLATPNLVDSIKVTWDF